MHEAYRALDMEQVIYSNGAKPVTTTRCPIRMNEEKFKSDTGAPKLGQHNQQILEELKEIVH
jgi:crotonobetainyl-CoA:carnitine CoA-transferase CaiB-like acyl-CoA transferase